MRRRSKRDLLTLLGLVVIIAGVVLANGYMRRAGLRVYFDKMRAELEAKHREEGVSLIYWDLMQKVVGRRSTGATFPEELKQLDGRLVNIVGFMGAIDQFRDVKEFMLLPIPLTCYFCDAPPMRDIIEVKLQKSANMINEPVLIGGGCACTRKKPLFFYTMRMRNGMKPYPKRKPRTKSLSNSTGCISLTGLKNCAANRLCWIRQMNRNR